MMPCFLKSFVLQWILILTVSGYCPPACICKDGEEIGVECLNAGLEVRKSFWNMNKSFAFYLSDCADDSQSGNSSSCPPIQ